QRRFRHAVEALEPLDHRPGIAAVEVDLGAIARRQDRRFLDLRLAEQGAQGGCRRVRMERDLLPHPERRGRMVQTEGVKRHGSWAFRNRDSTAAGAGFGGKGLISIKLVGGTRSYYAGEAPLDATPG